MSHTELVGELLKDPSSIVGSGSFACLRQLDMSSGAAQYDMLEWFSKDQGNELTWRRLYRAVDDTGNDLPGEGWVTEYMVRARHVEPNAESVAALRNALREIRDCSVPVHDSTLDD